LANELNRAFSKEEVQMAKKSHEKMLTITDHKGNANQNTLRFQLTTVRTDTIKNTNNNKC
jgi:hypothetical protein